MGEKERGSEKARESARETENKRERQRCVYIRVQNIGIYIYQFQGICSEGGLAGSS